jgi:ATP-binding cassette subfamily B protein
MYKKYRTRLTISQVLVLISATAIIGVVSLNQQLINEGIETGDVEVILGTGLWMLVLTLVSGLCLAGTAYFAVFFSQGTGHFIRAYLYRKIQTFSFGNFDRFRTGDMLLRLNADVVNIQNALLYMTLLLLYAPFMLLVTYILTINNKASLIWVLVLVTMVVLAVNFMGAVFIRESEDLLEYGAGIALPIAALGVFLGMRAWSTKISRETPSEESRNTGSNEAADIQESEKE